MNNNLHNWVSGDRQKSYVEAFANKNNFKDNNDSVDNILNKDSLCLYF